MKQRVAIIVRGVVQGVGFRPHVHGLACRMGLAGFVRNEAGSVRIEVEGEKDTLDQFIAELSTGAPPLATIIDVHCEEQVLRDETDFTIASSEVGSAPVYVSPDVATCDACLRELFDPGDRRFRYPFLNCTNCGPRLTIVTGAPYDRPRTTMAAFAMCTDCRAEYEDPGNRRFHAQPIACPACGPRLCLRDGSGRPIECEDPLALFAQALLRGQIGAIKGLGGYHLACDARNEDAVRSLRSRKHRDEKPFAVMMANANVAEEYCAVSPRERELLCSFRRPIVLLRHKGPGTLQTLARENPYLGVMLPYTPLHHLLMDAVGAIPLVMTSGNRSDEPIAHEDADALTRLAGIADIFLTHDRPIRVRCDDSVTRVVGSSELLIRRSRGYAPQTIQLPMECPQVLAVGGQLKGTFALGRGRDAFLSQHLGDLDHLSAFQAFERDVRLFEELFGVRPELVAHDLHPDYATTRHATERSRREGISTVAVQHHHAHMASCMAENGLTGPAIGVTFDGTGYGLDGAIWGGEFLTGGYSEFRRAAHLRYVRMPGGEMAIREPWRMAIAHLIDAGLEASSRVPTADARIVRSMLDKNLNCPSTSSVGRLFDAVASIAGVRDRVGYEGQAAVELEWLAAGAAPDGIYPFEIAASNPLIVDTRPLIRAAARDAAAGTGAGVIARRFHSTLVAIVADVCVRLRQAEGWNDVVLTGGVFLNALLTVETTTRLTGEGFRVFRHRQAPPNDGGLSLGQLAVAAARRSADET